MEKQHCQICLFAENRLQRSGVDRNAPASECDILKERCGNPPGILSDDNWIIEIFQPGYSPGTKRSMSGLRKVIAR